MPTPQPADQPPASPFDFPLDSPPQPPQPEPSAIRLDDLVVPEIEEDGIEIDVLAPRTRGDEGVPGPNLGELPVEVVSPPTNPNVSRSMPSRSRLWVGRTVAWGIAATALLAGGVYWGIGLGRMTGELTAEVVLEPQLPPRSVSTESVNLPAAQVTRVLEELHDSPLTLTSPRAVVKLTAVDSRLEVAVTPGKQSALYRVEVSQDRALAKYVREQGPTLEAARRADLALAVEQLFLAMKPSEPKSRPGQDVSEFRDRVGFAASVRRLGYFVGARQGENLWPCVYEDEDALYFFLPAGTRRFDLCGFPRAGAKGHFPGVYQVHVLP